MFRNQFQDPAIVHGKSKFSDTIQLIIKIVFVARYLDLFFHFVSIYNTLMKIFFISTSGYILYLMKYPYRSTYEPSLDTFRLEFVLAPSAVLALIFHYNFTILEVFTIQILVY